jgi:hypothetical protein
MVAGGIGALFIKINLAVQDQMDYLIRHLKPVSISLFVAVSILASGCSNREAVTEQSFVGKWKSSKIAAPVYMYANGEWEIKAEDGVVLQYGVWQYKNGKIIWSYKVDSHIGHDANAILSATPREFQLRESDRTTTTFTKLD